MTADEFKILQPGDIVRKVTGGVIVRIIGRGTNSVAYRGRTLSENSPHGVNFAADWELVEKACSGASQ